MCCEADNFDFGKDDDGVEDEGVCVMLVIVVELAELPFVLFVATWKWVWPAIGANQLLIVKAWDLYAFGVTTHGEVFEGFIRALS
nr:hypothetical protein [Tanacetum cinerariifolium]